ncbi:MAG TPA: alkaline phosphatase family protein, partial [Solirubrobacteraceae bacterium]
MRRRALIALLAGAAACAAPAAAAAAPPKPVTPIHHLVVLMQANHSFDNYFGTYPGADGTPKGTCQPLSLTRRAAGCVRPFHLGDRPVPDLDHPLDVFRRQRNGGRMNGFVAAYRQVGAGTHQSVMGYYDERDLPFAWAVARRYVLFDRFFTSASAGTLANHMFWMTGRRGTNDQDQIPPQGFGTMPTIFDRLQAAGISWRVYVENYDPGVTYRNRGAGPRRSQPATVPLLAFDRFLDDKRLFRNIVDLDQYYDDLRDGKLPAVSYIVTSASSERPPGSVAAGQQLVRTLVESLISS